jgi:hypothetical protein
MFTTLTVLTVLITLMFIGSVISSIAALREEARENDEFNRRAKTF